MPKINAPEDQGGSQTAVGYGSQSPKITELPGIDGDLVGKKYGSCVPKIYENVKTKNHRSHIGGARGRWTNILQKNLHKKRILVNDISGWRIMEYHICTSRGVQGIKNTGGANIIVDEVDTITNLFLHRYINSKEHVRRMQQFTGWNSSTAPAIETNNSNKRNKPHARNEKWKKGTSRKFLKLMENFVDDLIEICQKFGGKYATPITQTTAWDTHSLSSNFGQQIR